MRLHSPRFAVLLLLWGCYSHHPIPLDQLQHLTAAPGRAPEARIKGLDCGGCEIALDATTPLILKDAAGRDHRLTPFYFHMSAAQLVSPDYGLLLERVDIKGAEVR
ncbi:hypothetical protein KKB55_18150, partial [Myxococcota bacterium]|nr:hypothetical protein [Myxococcota bacterium]